MHIILHTGVKCVTMDENKSRVFDLFNGTAVCVVEDDIISNRQCGHCGSSKGRLNTSPLSAARFLINEAVYNIPPAWQQQGKDHRAQGKQQNQVLYCFDCQIMSDVCSLFAHETQSERLGRATSSSRFPPVSVTDTPYLASSVSCVALISRHSCSSRSLSAFLSPLPTVKIQPREESFH